MSDVYELAEICFELIKEQNNIKPTDESCESVMLAVATEYKQSGLETRWMEYVLRHHRVIDWVYIAEVVEDLIEVYDLEY
jgi:hypothetical protein